MWNYENYKDWLRARLIEIKNGLEYLDYNIEVFNEQDFAKKKSMEQKTITVIIKCLPSTILFTVKTQPVQMLVVSEGNGLSVANEIITKFCETYNLKIEQDGNTYIKNTYSTPTVLGNFELVGIMLRSVLYVNVTLFIMENVVDLKDLYIDNLSTGKPIEVLSATIGYSMQGDSQPFDGGYAQTQKNFATFTMTITIPCVNSDLITKALNIMSMRSAQKGNEKFRTHFTIGGVVFDFYLILTDATFTTAANNVPGFMLSFKV